jgi:hypothetical protein
METKIITAKEILKRIGVVRDIWPGFTPVPFILYDDKGQAAAGGDDWPERYTHAAGGIWTAEGSDPQLMGCTAIEDYHGQMVAIWDTRTWPDTPDIAEAAAGLAHEMFHCYQITTLKPPFPNELIAPQYLHTARSVALTVAENELLAEIFTAQPEAIEAAEAIRGLLEKIAGLRKQRRDEIGAEFMQYDDALEGFEGTAMYIQVKTHALLKGENVASISKFYAEPGAHSAAPLYNKENLLNGYRLRCLASGAALCFAADALADGWQTEWTASGISLFEWLKQKLSLNEAACCSAFRVHPPDNTREVFFHRERNAITHSKSDSRSAYLTQADLHSAAELIETFREGKQRQIDNFLAQPVTLFEGGIQLTGFDPMNLVCEGNRCLHMRAGRLTICGRKYLAEHPFLTEFGSSIMDVRRLWLPERNANDLHD